MSLVNEDFDALLHSARGFVVYRLDVIDAAAETSKSTVAFVSPSLYEVMGIDPDTPFENWFDGIHANDRDRVKASSDLAGDRGEAFDEVFRTYHAPAKEWRWVHAISHPVFDGEQVVQHYNGMMIDVTAQKEAELREAGMRETLERNQRLQSLGMLAGGIAHDFNNLLTVIGGNATLIETTQSQVDGDIAKYLSAIENSVARGAGLTQQLLSFARHGTQTLEVVDVRPLVLEVIEGLARLRKDVLLNLHLDEPLWTRVARSEFERVIVNIVTNAFDAMPDGGELSVIARTAGDGKHHTLKIADSGQGMSAEVLEKMFDTFFTTKERGSGTGLGLGLAAAKGIVERLGGTLTAVSKPGKGAILSIEIDAETPPSQAEQPEPEAHADVERGPLRILVVDDELLVRRTLCAMLQSLGHETMEADSAEQALSLVGTEQFDLLVLDMVMPGLSGGKLARKLVEHHTGDLPFLVCSGYADEEHIRQAEEAGAAGFIQKPVGRAELARRLLEIH